MSSSSGGAIYSTSLSKLLVETSTFVSCSASSQGGAIYISKGDCVIHEVCGYHCTANSQFSFSDVWQSSGTKDKNYVHDSSVAYCVASNYYTMYHYYGYIEIKSVNLSHNEATRYSALRCYPSSKQGTYGTSISYSSFADNTASYYCIYLWYITSSSANKYEIKNSNIIRNSGDRTIYVYNGELTMRKTCMMNNKKATYHFYLQQSSAKCTLLDCSIDNTQKTGSGSLDTSSIGSNSFINGLTFISTGDCKNIFDTIDNIPLTGVVQRTPERTPDQTPSQTKNNFQNTCAEYLIAFPAQDVFRMLEYIFMLCFLPTC